MSGRLARAAYSALLYLLLPGMLARLWWRGRALPAYRRRWRERLALGLDLPPAPRLWIHAVSVGEVNAAAPLIEALLAQAGPRLLVTTTTPTGSQTLRRRFGEQVDHVYFPWDLPDAVARFLRAATPRMLVVMETELWPNVYAACARRSLPLLVVNARLSQRSLRGYQRLGGLSRATLAAVTRVFAQGEADARRFAALGAPAQRIEVIGNLKFDFHLPPAALDWGPALRAAWPSARRFVWIAASTHAGEEEQVLAAHRRLLAAAPEALLLLVPRHPERFDAVAALCRRRGMTLARRSADEPVTATTQVWLCDTLGELTRLYGVADVAFVGGSLVDVGGHNPLEPSAHALPVLTGPVVHNFADIYARMIAAGAARQVDDAQALARTLIALADDAGARRREGETARRFLKAHQGGVERLAAYIAEALAPQSQSG